MLSLPTFIIIIIIIIIIISSSSSSLIIDIYHTASHDGVQYLTPYNTATKYIKHNDVNNKVARCAAKSRSFHELNDVSYFGIMFTDS